MMGAFPGGPAGRRALVVGLSVAVTWPLAACGTGSSAPSLSLSSLSGITDIGSMTRVSLVSTGESVTVSQAGLTFSPTLGSKNVLPGAPIMIEAVDGRLTDVSVTSPTGAPVPGEFSQDGRTWSAREQSLGYGAAYTVSATAVDRNGLTTTTTEGFRTLVPKETASVASVSPESGSSFGVGMPLTVTFDRDIENKAEVEKRLIVRTPKPIEGAWRWIDSSTAEYRPKSYWPGNIPIEVQADLTGVQVAKGIWGEKSRTYSFTTTDAIVGTVDMDNYTLTVRRNGAVVRTIPITTGKSGFETRSGVKVVMSKERNRIMDAATGGTDPTSPEYYRLNVEYAMRLTWSGEFLHAAPWSVGSQGYANVSHGCTGMSTGNAAWLYGISNVGDVYEYVGNDKPLYDNDNGITVWNTPWEDWLAESEAGAAKTTALPQT